MRVRFLPQSYRMVRSTPVLTLSDQLVSSASNFALGVLVARVGGASALGAFGLAYLVWIAAFGTNRAIVTEPMTVALKHDTDHRALRSGMAATLLLGLGWAGLLALVGGIMLIIGADAGPILALAPWMPTLLLQDYWRASAFRLHRAGTALASDVTFAVVQALLIGALFALDTVSVSGLITAWGLGGTAGALVGLCLFEVRACFRGGFSLLRTLWPQSRWFGTEFVTAYVSDQGYLLLLPLLLGTISLGIYRAGASLIGPIIVLFMAGNSIALPACVRCLRSGGIEELTRWTLRFSVIIVGFTTVYCALVAGLARPLLVVIYGPQFADGAIITQVVALQYVIFSMGIGSAAALKASGQIRKAWLVRLVGAAVSVGGVIALATSNGLVGAAFAGVAAALIFSGGLIGTLHRLQSRAPRHLTSQVTENNSSPSPRTLAACPVEQIPPRSQVRNEGERAVRP